jgi:16S rRNA (guanine966-N2)-methyltransferase
MRIISGTYRGFRLRSLKGAGLRPTSDQMRETLFDVLGPSIVGSRFLDGYAGSGAVGLEALSRGAAEVVLVENHRGAQELIRRNLEAVHAAHCVQLLGSRLESALERLAQGNAPFDYVFLDPPYAEIAEYHRALRQLGRSPLIGPASVVIAEHSRHVLLEERYGGLERRRSIRHGDSQLTFYQPSTKS